MKMRISLCLIVWNELQGCQKDVPYLPLEDFDEVYAVDGGSTDGTVEYLQKQSIPVYRQPLKGLNNAYRHSRDKSTTDAVVVFFPKGTVDPACVTQFRNHLENGYSLVVASRNIPNAHNEEDEHRLRPRKWMVMCMALLIAIIWRRQGDILWDILHGIKAFHNSAFDQMHILDHGLSIDLEMAVRSYKLCMNRKEFPISETRREYGGTHFSIWPTGKKLLAYLWFELFREELPQ